MGILKSDTLTSIYESRIGKSTTEDEAMGYWVFVFGVLVGIIGFIALILSFGTSQIGRLLGNVMLASSLTLLLVGQIIRLPLTKKALPFLYVGVVLCFAGIAWFASVYPEGWTLQVADNEIYIITLYGLGILSTGIAGIVTPLITSPIEPKEKAEEEARESEKRRKDTEEQFESYKRRMQNSQSQFELYEDKAGKYRWRLRHRNGNIIAEGGQGYSSKQKLRQGVNAVRRDSLGGSVIELESPEEDEELLQELESQSEFELYEDKAGKYRWRLKHKNGNILTDSGQGYSSKNECEKSVERVRQYVLSANYLNSVPSSIQMYKDKAGKYRWRLVNQNGTIMANSGQGYSSKQKANQGMNSFRSNLDEDAFDVYQDEDENYRWRLRHKNGNIVASCVRSFDSKSSARKSVNRVINNADNANVQDVMNAVFELYKDNGGKHRWRLRHQNGRILCDSGQGYSSRQKAIKGLNSVKRDVKKAKVVENEE